MLRKVLIALLVVGALASIALCGSYGFDQATETKDRIVQAFIYGFVAAAALALHGGALHLWVAGWRKLGFVAGVVAVLAFAMTVFTSLGGMATRSDKVLAERQDAVDQRTDTKGQIDALVAEKARLKYSWTTQAAVDAAQRLADTAKQNREAECAKRGDNCRAREGDERKALESLATAQANKATTDRVIEIDAELKRLRATKTDGTVGNVDPLKALLVRALGTWGAMLSDWQKLGFAVIYDLVLVALMLIIEATAPKASTSATRREDVSTKTENSDTLSTPVEQSPATALAEPCSVPPEIVAPEPMRRLPPPARPRLATARKEPPAAPIPRIMTAALDPAKGRRVNLEACFHRYVAESRAEGRDPVETDIFLDAMVRFCKSAGIKTKVIDGILYLMDVQLVEPRDHEVVSS